jgi:LmbE family N-acetylglucosaminyl deacetylase
VSRLDLARLERCDSLFVAPHGDDVALACPARLLAEAESGRRALVLALFEPVDRGSRAERAARDLGAGYAAAGLAAWRERRSREAPPAAAPERNPEDEAAALEAARLLIETLPRLQPLHVYAPLGLGASADHRLAYEAALRAFASEAGRNLFLYEERPEAFVPGAVRTRLALLGARLPPGASKSPERASVVRHLWRIGEPERLRGEGAGIAARLRARAEAWRRHRLAAPWNPLRALGPRLHPVVHVADEEARARAQAAAHLLLPKDRKGRSRAAERFNARASASAKRLGGVYHAERFWLVLPSHDGLPEVQHPLEASGR